MIMKKDRIWIGVFICLLVAGIAGSVFMYRKSDKKTVVIMQDKKELYRINLEDYTKPHEIEIKYGDGINRILIENGQIRVVYADCPDNTCVKMGNLSSDAMPIACLPHHLIIKYADDDNLPDGITG